MLVLYQTVSQGLGKLHMPRPVAGVKQATSRKTFQTLFLFDSMLLISSIVFYCWMTAILTVTATMSAKTVDVIQWFLLDCFCSAIG
jgi:hypothetical protein